MRWLVMAGLTAAALATPANACPQPARCIAMISAPHELTSVRTQRTEVPAESPAARHVSLSIRTSNREEGHQLRKSLTSFRPVVSQAEDIEVPELWAVVASRVKNQLPRYEDNEKFSLVLSPVVVSMPSESTPGLGVSGDF